MAEGVVGGACPYIGFFCFFGHTVTNFAELLFAFQGQGLDDTRIKYYPFRDDAITLMDEFNIFIEDLLRRYYGSTSYQVRADKELQSWVNELSIDGKIQPDGGKGKVSENDLRFI